MFQIVSAVSVQSGRLNHHQHPSLFVCYPRGPVFDLLFFVQLREIVVAGKSFRYRALPNEHQHTQPSTGLLLWESARVLATYLDAHPEILRGRSAQTYSQNRP